MAVPVSEAMVDTLRFIEQEYYVTGNIPTVERICEVVGVTKVTVEKYLKQESFREALQKRGVSLSQLVDGIDASVLTLKQLECVSYMLNTIDKRSTREKLKEIGVSTQTFNSWMRDPLFAGYVKKRAEAKFNEADSTAYISIVKSMEAGDLNATKLFLEMRGIYNPKVTLEVNVDMVLSRVIEIVANRVKDPVILAKIADDMEMIEGVGTRMAIPEFTKPPISVGEVPELTLSFD